MDGHAVWVSVFAAGIGLALWKYRQDVAEAIRNFTDHFRGGPPRPMHPSPACDGALLRKRAKRAENWPISWRSLLLGGFA